MCMYIRIYVLQYYIEMCVYVYIYACAYMFLDVFIPQTQLAERGSYLSL